MSKKLVVEKSKFDAVLTNLINKKPVPRSSVKATGTRAQKAPRE